MKIVLSDLCYTLQTAATTASLHNPSTQVPVLSRALRTVYANMGRYFLTSDLIRRGGGGRGGVNHLLFVDL